MAFWDFVGKEWKTVTGAPLTFVVLASLAVSGGVWIGGQWRNPELAAKDTYIGQLEKEKADSASIVQQAREALDVMMQQKLDALAEELGKGKPSDIQFWSTPDPNSDYWAKAISGAMMKGGWNTEKVSPQWPGMVPDKDTVVVQPANASDLMTVEKAFSDAMISFEKRPPAEGQTVPQLWVEIIKNAPPL